MASADPRDEDILEIVDQRRPAAHPLKYIVWGIVGLAFVICGYRLLLHFTPRAVVGAVTSPLEKSAALTGRFLAHVGSFLTKSRVSTTSEIEIGRVTATDKLGPLIVARQDLAVRFTNVDEHIFGTSTAEVRAFGQAYYFVPLLGPSAAWKIENTERNGVRVCIVHAPALRVLTPVNVDTRRIEIRATTGAFRSNQQEMTEAALADITPRFNQEARLREPEVRQAARKTISAFIKTWLEGDANWGTGRMNAIQVLFPGEAPVDAEFAIPGFYEHP
ncbi:MAG: hypothetical protein ABIV50_06965 [Opitutus sp.]